MDVRWESNVNWRTLNPDEKADEGENEQNDALFVPIIHTAPTPFEATYVHDIIEESDPAFYQEEGGLLDFKYYRRLIANHLSLFYKIGLLRWPKLRCKTVDLDGNIYNGHNTFPRTCFRHAGDF